MRSVTAAENGAQRGLVASTGMADHGPASQTAVLHGGCGVVARFPDLAQSVSSNVADHRESKPFHVKTKPDLANDVDHEVVVQRGANTVREFCRVLEVEPHVLKLCLSLVDAGTSGLMRFQQVESGVHDRVIHRPKLCAEIPILRHFPDKVWLERLV